MTSDVILVAGVDYPHFDADKNPPGDFPLKYGTPGATRRKHWNWRRCAERLAQVAAQKYGKDLRVIFFDFDVGTREVWIKSGGELKRTERLSLGALKYGNHRIVDKDAGVLRALQPQWPRKLTNGTPPSISYFAGIDKLPAGLVSFSDYESEWMKLANGEGSKLSETSISIIHVYDYIRTIGAARKPGDVGGVQELHFLSHAWQGGPILANTTDLYTLFPDMPHSDRRDPFDKDGRASKDFTETNFTGKQLEQFRSAFAHDAFAFVWGCDATFFWKELIRQTLKQQGNGNTTFRFTYTYCWGDKGTFDRRLLDPSSGRSKQFSLDDLRKAIQAELRSTFMQALANAIQKPVIGALPGTSSDPDQNVPAEYLLWHVSITGEDSRCLHPDNWEKWLQFYRRELKVTFDDHFTFNLDAFKTDFKRGFIRYGPLVG